ncbi:MAG: restriction endonuclease subunit S [Coriobacteriales bacterium]|nr:restriction endonuclease subunit S [Coriobacteriales bacterium]
MKARDLRNSILQMAVQGKLVPQDPADEPASVLVERIRKERAQLIKEKKIRAPRGGESIIYRDSDGSHYEKRVDARGREGEPQRIEVPFEIPEGWAWVRLTTVAEVQLGKMLNKQKNQGSPKPYLGNINVQWNRFDLADVKTMLFRDEELDKFRLIPGDLMICEGGVPGRCAIWDSAEEMYYQKAIHRVRCNPSVLAVEYCHLVISLIVNSHALDHEFTGTTIKHLPARALEQWKIPLPPVREQQRIVRTFNQIDPLVDAYGALEDARERLDAELPSRLRKSVLQMAVQGKLVPQDPSDEPASALLGRIRAERAKLIKEKKLKAPRGGESVIFRASDGGHYEKRVDARGREGEPQRIEVPFEIPEGWAWCRLSTIVGLRIGKTPSRHDERYWNNGIHPWFSIADMDDTKTIYEPKERISDEAMSERFKAGMSPAGTLIMSFKLTIGKTSILGIDAVHNEAIVSVIPCYDVQHTLRNYLLRALPFAAQNGDYKGAIKGNTLNSKSMSMLLIPLPPLEEQRRICSCIDMLLGYITNQ